MSTQQEFDSWLKETIDIAALGMATTQVDRLSSHPEVSPEAKKVIIARLRPALVHLVSAFLQDYWPEHKQERAWFAEREFDERLWDARLVSLLNRILPYRRLTFDFDLDLIPTPRESSGGYIVGNVGVGLLPGADDS